LSLDVTVVERGARARQARGLGPWLARSAPKSARGDVTVAIVADATMRALNRQFRRKDKVTDVLSFPVEQRAKGPKKGPGLFFGETVRKTGPAPFSARFLGEIVIARGVAARQARALGHPVGTELRILALHGLLHLLGYDHEVDKGQMARTEARLRRRAGLPAGLIARSS
jgi:probable rRNA maturation factor